MKSKESLKSVLGKENAQTSEYFQKLDTIIGCNTKADGMFRDFVTSTCQLAWQMALQNPVMRLEICGIGEKPDEDRQNILPTKNENFNKMELLRVNYYHEPFLIHADRIHVKGRVVVHASKDNRIQ